MDISNKINKLIFTDKKTQINQFPTNSAPASSLGSGTLNPFMLSRIINKLTNKKLKKNNFRFIRSFTLLKTFPHASKPWPLSTEIT